MRSSTQHNLSRKYYGPFLILEKIGSVAYRLYLPTISLVHPTFYVSLLIKSHGIPQAHTPLPSVEYPRGSLFLPEAILERKLDKNHNRVAVRVLVHWRDRPLTNATWEFLDDLQVHCPDFNM